MSLTSYQAAPPRDPEGVNIPVVLALARSFCEKLLAAATSESAKCLRSVFEGGEQCADSLSELTKINCLRKEGRRTQCGRSAYIA